MIDMAPDHPITRHVSVAYWKGGDERIEAALYDPRRIEKIVAWGGFAGIKHLTQYLQPGLDLITLDPKHSATIIGPEAFADDRTLLSVARRLAVDIGALNQEGCVNARVVYVQSGTDEAGLTRVNRLGALTFEAIKGLPPHLSTPHKAFDPELRSEIEALRFVDDEYKLFGGRGNEGAVIVSQSDVPVDFALDACLPGGQPGPGRRFGHGCPIGERLHANDWDLPGIAQGEIARSPCFSRRAKETRFLGRRRNYFQGSATPARRHRARPAACANGSSTRFKCWRLRSPLESAAIDSSHQDLLRSSRLRVERKGVVI